MAKYVKVEWKDPFFSKIEKTDTCWIWKGAKNSYGYGMIYLRGIAKNMRAHRYSYELHHGRLSSDDVVMHSCDNPICVNPEHLSKGTRLDNNRDAVNKRRNQHGERHWASKLTSSQVIEIQALPGTHDEIAKLYGLHQSTVSRIKAGKRRSKG